MKHLKLWENYNEYTSRTHSGEQGNDYNLTDTPTFSDSKIDIIEGQYIDLDWEEYDWIEIENGWYGLKDNKYVLINPTKKRIVTILTSNRGGIIGVLRHDFVTNN